MSSRRYIPNHRTKPSSTHARGVSNMRSSKSANPIGWSTESTATRSDPTARLRTPVDASRHPAQHHAQPWTVPPLTDLRITQGLLNAKPSTARPASSARVSSQQGRGSDGDRSLRGHSRWSSHTSQRSTADTSRGAGSRVTSTTWTTVSNRDIAGSSRSDPLRLASIMSKFDGLAQGCGLPNLAYYQNEESAHTRDPSGENDSPSLSTTSTKNWLFRKLVRKTASVRPLKPAHRRSLSKRLGAFQTRPNPDGTNPPPTRSLDDMSRLGGISMFVLPPKFSPWPLAVPTCLAATGNYVVQNCMFVEHWFSVWLLAADVYQGAQRTVSFGFLDHTPPSRSS